MQKQVNYSEKSPRKRTDKKKTSIKIKSMECSLCQKIYGKNNTGREHFCKQCFRSICQSCGMKKKIIIGYSIKPSKPHKICDICSSDTISQEKIRQNYNLKWGEDSKIGDEWLSRFTDLKSTNIHKLDAYLEEGKQKIAQFYEKKGCVQFRKYYQKLTEVFIEDGFPNFSEKFGNYSLDEFLFYCQKEQSWGNVQRGVREVMMAFLGHNYDIGFCKEMIALVNFLLCFFRPCKALKMMEFLYRDVLPLYFHPHQYGFFFEEHESDDQQEYFQQILVNEEMQNQQIQQFLEIMRNNFNVEVTLLSKIQVLLQIWGIQFLQTFSIEKINVECSFYILDNMINMKNNRFGFLSECLLNSIYSNLKVVKKVDPSSNEINKELLQNIFKDKIIKTGNSNKLQKQIKKINEKHLDKSGFFESSFAQFQNINATQRKSLTNQATDILRSQAIGENIIEVELKELMQENDIIRKCNMNMENQIKCFYDLLGDKQSEQESSINKEVQFLNIDHYMTKLQSEILVYKEKNKLLQEKFRRMQNQHEEISGQELLDQISEWKKQHIQKSEKSNEEEEEEIQNQKEIELKKKIQSLRVQYEEEKSIKTHEYDNLSIFVKELKFQFECGEQKLQKQKKKLQESIIKQNSEIHTPKKQSLDINIFTPKKHSLNENNTDLEQDSQKKFSSTKKSKSLNPDEPGATENWIENQEQQLELQKHQDKLEEINLHLNQVQEEKNVLYMENIALQSKVKETNQGQQEIQKYKQILNQLQDELCHCEIILQEQQKQIKLGNEKGSHTPSKKPKQFYS